MNPSLNAWLVNIRSQQTYRLVHPDTTIGRSPDNHIVIFEDPSLSRQHAMIRHQNGVYTLITLMARTPIRLNDRIISSPTQLFHGNVLLMGQTELRFMRDSGGRLA